MSEVLDLFAGPGGWDLAARRSKRFQQIGNAIPPLMARAILGEVIGG